MFDPQQYQLLDFGEGRKLERFGPYVLDRPSPAAERQAKADPSLWKTAHARFQRSDSQPGGQQGGRQGSWTQTADLPATWTIHHDSLCFELKLTDFGHVGLFVEQAANWDWIARQVPRAGRELKILNLFAYTGGSTLAAASCGGQVVHVDAARNVVAWARRNARLSGLASAAVRWISEDARKFIRRERRRGNRYDAVILDPPTYGHGPQGQVWKLARDLAPLLSDCAALTRERRAFMLVTCHTEGFGPAELEALLADTVLGGCQQGAIGRRLSIRAADGRRLPSGVVARWP